MQDRHKNTTSITQLTQQHPILETDLQLVRMIENTYEVGF